MQPAPLYKRIIAYLIDLAIVNLIIVSPFKSLLGSLIPTAANFIEFYTALTSMLSTKVIIITLISGIFAILYWSILEFKIQQTLGSLIMGISVMPLTKKYNFSQALLRNITKFSLILLLLDSIFIFKSDRNQRLTERLSQTMTI